MNANKTIIALTVAALTAADSYAASVEKLRAAVSKSGIDLTNEFDVRQALIHGVGEKRKIKVRVATNNAGNEVASGKLTFDTTDEAKAKLALQALKLLTRHVMGKQSNEKAQPAVTAAMKKAAKAFVEACGSKAAALAAIKAI